MPVILSSTTDSPEEVQRAVEASGQVLDSLDVLTNEPAKPEEEPAKPKEPAAPAADAQVEAEAGEGKTAAESGTEEEEAQEEPPSGKAKPGPKPGAAVQKRIDELTRERYERDGRIAELQRRIDDLSKPKEAEPKPAEAKPEPGKPAEPAKPKPVVGDYPDYEAFVEALTDWKAEQRESKLQAQFDAKLAEAIGKAGKESRAELEADAAAEDWNGRIEQAKARYDDWDQVAAAGKDVLISAAISDALFEDEQGPDVLYYLTAHPEEAKKVFEATNYDPAKTPPGQVLSRNRAAGREFARIKDLVSKLPKPEADKPAAPKPAAAPPESKPKPKAASAAPAPISPVKPGAPEGGIDPYNHPEQMTTAQYIEWRRTHPRG